MNSTAAQTAKAIRKELKSSFPSTTFTIHSKNFAGGNSVRINWNNGPTYKMVDDLVSKYAYGSFNGMNDMYENDNNNDSIPQVKYVLPSRNITEDIANQTKLDLAKNYGLLNINDEYEWRNKTGRWSTQAVYNVISELVLPDTK